MDVLGGGLWIPPGIVQHIQDKDPSLRLCYVCKDIKINRVQWGIDKLSGKKLKGKLGGSASIMFAYSSGDIDHLLALIPDRIRIKKRANAYSLWLMVTFSRTYSERMSIFRTILWIPILRHTRLLKT